MKHNTSECVFFFFFFSFAMPQYFSKFFFTCVWQMVDKDKYFVAVKKAINEYFV